MSEITAGMVKRLRDATGAGMMECKRALVQTDGDHDAAVTLLREKGMASAAKRADRETKEGVVLTRIEGGTAAIVAVGCETEPVSKNDDFRSFAQTVLDAVFADGDDATATLDDQRVEVGARLGENIQVVGARRLTAGESESFSAYVHPPANKIGVLLEVKGGTPELARQLAKLPTLTLRYMRVATAQRLKEMVVREVGHGLALQGLSGAALGNPGPNPRPEDKRG